jgi:molecular chaperone DnaK
MVKDAEANAEEDRKARELADARNQADALIHSTRKALTEFGDKLEGGEKEKIEAGIKDLEDAVRGGDKAEIDAKVAALSEVSQKLGEKVYADMQAKSGEAGAAGAAGAGAAGGGQQQAQPQDDNVVDAEFKEVNDKK